MKDRAVPPSELETTREDEVDLRLRADAEPWSRSVDFDVAALELRVARAITAPRSTRRPSLATPDFVAVVAAVAAGIAALLLLWPTHRARPAEPALAPFELARLAEGPELRRVRRVVTGTVRALGAANPLPTTRPWEALETPLQRELERLEQDGSRAASAVVDRVPAPVAHALALLFRS